MSELTRLAREADIRRDEFYASLAELTPRLRPTSLADAAIGKADPAFETLASLETSARRHPIWALAVLAGAWRLIAGMEDPAQRKPRPSRHPRARKSITSTARKEKSNGRHHEARD